MNPEDTIYSRVPCVVDLAGAGTDFRPYRSLHEGRLVTAALRFYSYAVLRPLPGGRVRIRTVHDGAEVTAETPDALVPEGPFAPIATIVQSLRMRRGFDLQLHSEIPFRSGGGSRIGMLLAAQSALFHYEGHFVERPERLRRALGLERLGGNDFGGYFSYPALLGSLHDQGLHEQTVEDYEFLIKNSVRLTLECQVLLADPGGVPSSSEPDQILEQNYRENEPETTKRLNRIKTTAQSVRNALSVGDLHHLPMLFNEEWAACREILGDAFDPRLDRFIERGRAAGAHGAKVCGMGKGPLLFYCERLETRWSVFQALQQEGCLLLPTHVDEFGIQSWSQPQENS